MNKAELTRIIELDRAGRGQKTEKSLDEILRAEREVAKKYIVTPVTTGQAASPTPPTVTET